MNLLRNIVLYLITLVTIIGCDTLWLKYIAHDWYMKLFGQWIQSFNIIPALCFYLLFVAGLHVFIIHMLPEGTASFQYALYGIFFGCVAYATYDLTNLATITNWPLYGACVDIVWGSCVAGFGMYVTAVLGKFWNLL